MSSHHRARPQIGHGSAGHRPGTGSAHYRRQLGRLLDTLGNAAVACELSGQIVHQTPAMSALLISDTQSDVLCDAVRAVVEESIAQARGRRAGVHSLTLPEREVATARTRYAVRSVIHDPGSAGAEVMIVAVIEPMGRRLRTEAELRDRYGLTAAELRVALLLGRGRSNAEIAAALALSPHTVRRHTEKILAKLRVRSRSEVGMLLHV